MLVMLGCIEGDYALYSLYQPELVEVEVPVEVIVEVPVEVIVEVPVQVPGEGGDVWIDSFEQPYTIDGIDIVWLIDKSGSMNQHATSVVAGIEQMMLSLPPSGWRLGITTTAWGNASTTSQFPLIPGDSVQDAWDSYNNTGNHGLEAGFDALYAYLIENTYNQSWLRPDAGLLVVFVSDEDEQSNRDFTSTPHGLLDFINWYGSQRPSVFLASIVNLPASLSSCQWSPPTFYVGDRYIDATTAFGGVVVDICDQDWTPGVQEAASQAQPHEEWELTYAPIEDSLIVFVDFAEFTDWTYDSPTNSVQFDVLPPEGSLVEIGYVIDTFLPNTGDDDDSAGDDDDSSGS
tara:strand:- start:4847 stop:5884 length:1038 start_codon:yes stop_codon:yes gene_type:complete